MLLPIILIIMEKRLPQEDFVGYNKENDHKKKEDSLSKNGLGLGIFLKNSYVLGIFGMMFFWEIVNFTFNNLRLNIAFSQAEKITEISGFLFKTTMITHLTGLILVIFGTTLFLRFLGERISLLLVPILTGIAVLGFLTFQNPLSVIIVYPFIAAINYSLSRPLRESLFIITSKSIQFSTKSWMDSFGQKFSKTCGSVYTILLQYLPRTIIYHFQIGFFFILIALWTTLAYFLGKKWQSTIDKNKVIS